MLRQMKTMEEVNQPEKWRSVDQVAEHLGVKRDTLYKWIDRRKLPAHKVGRLWKFKLSEVDRWVLNAKKK